MARPETDIPFQKYKGTNREILSTKKTIPSNVIQETKMYYIINDAGSNTSKRYKVYTNSKGEYFYLDGGSSKTITSKSALTDLSKGKNATVYTGGNVNTKPTNTPTKPQNTNTNTSNNSGSGSGSSSNSGSNDKYYISQINKLTKEIEELKKPKIWTAKELAELYGVTDQYNYENILKQYNEATNKYYDDSIAAQTEYNDDANKMNTTYANNLIKKYLDSYSTQAPTAVGRGVQAANALANSLNADQTAGEVATNLNSIVNNYQEQRKAELENNPLNARTDYNNIGSWLLSQGAKMNEADVQQYVDTLNAYATKYAANRNAQSSLANAAASAYQSNAQAALANAAYNNSMKDYKYYQYWYGDNAARAYANSLKDTNTTNIG